MSEVEVAYVAERRPSILRDVNPGFGFWSYNLGFMGFGLGFRV